MAIRLTAERILHAIVAAVFIVWLIVWATGCAVADNRDAEFALLNSQLAKLKVQMAGTIDESASPTTTAGDDATITNISFGSAGCMALMLGVLGWRHRTATGALDRVVGVIEYEHKAATVHGETDIARTIKALKGSIEFKALEHPNGPAGCPHERLIRSRLKRLKK